MPRYSGITTDLVRTRREHQAGKKNLRGWTQQRFRSPEAARRWESAQPGEHEPGGAPTTGPCWGYTFLYDKS